MGKDLSLKLADIQDHREVYLKASEIISTLQDYNAIHFIKMNLNSKNNFSRKWYLAKYKNKTVGVVALEKDYRGDKNIFEIDTLAVDNKYRGKGFGKEIINAVIKDIIKEKPVQALMAESDIRFNAGGFYEKLGFKIVKKLSSPQVEVYKLKLRKK